VHRTAERPRALLGVRRVLVAPKRLADQACIDIDMLEETSLKRWKF
jgi:hypothetical protein